jgi:hypothetical protein
LGYEGVDSILLVIGEGFLEDGRVGGRWLQSFKAAFDVVRNERGRRVITEPVVSFVEALLTACLFLGWVPISLGRE